MSGNDRETSPLRHQQGGGSKRGVSPVRLRPAIVSLGDDYRNLSVLSIDVVGRCAKCCGVYVPTGNITNNYPVWVSDNRMWLFSTRNGYWRITNSQDDFLTGAGYIISGYPHQGVLPDKITLWQSKKCVNVDVAIVSWGPPTSLSPSGSRLSPSRPAGRSLSRSVRSASRSPSPAAHFMAVLHKAVVPGSPLRKRRTISLL